MNEDYLCHHGVKGMKWGIRKNRRTSSGIFSRKSKKKTEKQNVKSEKKQEQKRPKKRLKDLSDAELQNKIRRLQMEKQYRDLKRDEVSVGKKLLGDILKTSGKTLGVQVANHLGGKAINKAFGEEVVKNVSTSKKKKKDKAD